VAGSWSALVPVNHLDRAKARLAALLTAGERQRLALATLHTVLAAATGAGATVTVFTSDPRVAAAAGPGIAVLDEDPALAGLNAQLEGAIRRLRPPPGELLILHADLPLASTAAIRAFVEAAPPAPSATSWQRCSPPAPA
jgi:2-phospho-L-lactate guanylyltransferase